MMTLETIETNYGTLEGITNFDSYPDGTLKSCMLHELNTINTRLGSFIPQYCANEHGERQKKHRSSLAFHPNGEIKSAALQYPTPIQTPLGSLTAELVTFYEDGCVNRLFPLNGLVNGYWTEIQERSMARKLELDLPVGKIKAKVIALHFYPSGALKSLTLWPMEIITIQTPIGEIDVRTGFSLYENGSVKSIEPARPTEIQTPIGAITAFEPEVMGMHADRNSVQFSPAGELVSLKSLTTGVIAIAPDGSQIQLKPLEVESQLDATDTRIIPLKIDFRVHEIGITDLKTITFDRATHQFSTFPVDLKLTSGCGGGCAESSSDGCENCDGSCETPEGCLNCDGSCGDNCISNRQ